MKIGYSLKDSSGIVVSRVLTASVYPDIEDTIEDTNLLVLIGKSDRGDYIVSHYNSDLNRLFYIGYYRDYNSALSYFNHIVYGLLCAINKNARRLAKPYSWRHVAIITVPAYQTFPIDMLWHDRCIPKDKEAATNLSITVPRERLRHSCREG